MGTESGFINNRISFELNDDAIAAVERFREGGVSTELLTKGSIR